MTGRPKHFMDQNADTFKFMIDLANLKDRDGKLMSDPTTKGRAFKFRQRLYGWRRSLRDAIADPDTEESRKVQQWLLNALGPRATKEWLYLTKFTVEELPNGLFATVACIDRPMYGGDIVFADDPAEQAKLAEARQILEQVLPAAKGRQFMEYAAKGNPEIRKQLDIEDGLRSPDPRPAYEDLLTPEGLFLHQKEQAARGASSAAEPPGESQQPTTSNVTQLPTAARAAGLVAGVDTDAIAFDRRCDPNEVRRRATTLAGDGLSPDMIEEILQREFR